MSTLGENIALFRKNKGFTQEKLAETIGISAQSVSKWENDVSMPDIALLPVLADIFSVSIDTLFGTQPEIESNKELLPEKTLNTMLQNIAGLWKIAPDSDEFKDYAAKINADDCTQTAVFTSGGGALFANQNIGLIFRKNPAAYAENLPEMAANCADVLTAFADRNVCVVLSTLLRNPMNYSVVYLSKKCTLSLEDTENALRILENIGFAVKSDFTVDESTIQMYHLARSQKMLFVYTMLLMAQKVTDPDSYFCYSGSSTWCYS